MLPQCEGKMKNSHNQNNNTIIKTGKNWLPEERNTYDNHNFSYPSFSHCSLLSVSSLSLSLSFRCFLFQFKVPPTESARSQTLNCITFLDQVGHKHAHRIITQLYCYAYVCVSLSVCVCLLNEDLWETTTTKELESGKEIMHISCNDFHTWAAARTKRWIDKLMSWRNVCQWQQQIKGSSRRLYTLFQFFFRQIKDGASAKLDYANLNYR